MVGLLSQLMATISIYKLLKGSRYIKLPSELKNPTKGLINLKNNDDQCFRWCHIRHLNNQTKHSDKLNYDGVELPVSQKDYYKI